jgi:hypothetical protein
MLLMTDLSESDSIYIHQVLVLIVITIICKIVIQMPNIILYIYINIIQYIVMLAPQAVLVMQYPPKSALRNSEKN